MPKTKRPDLRAYFRYRIAVRSGRFDAHVPVLPDEVERIIGDVTDERIAAVMSDGTAWTWKAGRYGSRSILLPEPEAGPLPLVEQR